MVLYGLHLVNNISTKAAKKATYSIPILLFFGPNKILFLGLLINLKMFKTNHHEKR
jgi:hypothetical protein